MELTDRNRYDAPLDAVWAMLTDPAFRDDVCRATGASSWDVHIGVDDGGGTVSVRRVLPAEVSDVVRSLVGETVTIVQEETWGPLEPNGARSADVLLRVDGQPVAMRGTTRLSPAGAGAVLETVGDLEVRIPLVGGKLAKELGAAVTAAFTKEHEVRQRHLA